jgi:3-oxoacyl-[acyl-carrier-protein] synthase II
MERETRVVITGLGPLTAVGTGKERLWGASKEGASNVTLEDYYIDGEHWGKFPISKVRGFDIEDFGLPPGAAGALQKDQENNSRDLLYLLASSKLALDDSRLDFDREDNEVGLVLTCENPGLDDFISRVMQSTLDIAEGRPPAPRRPGKRGLIEGLYERFEKRVYNLQTFMYLHHVSKALGLHGPSLFINNACASGLYAVEAASQQIRSGQAAAVVVAGADHASHMTKHLWFSRLGLYSAGGMMRPFDRHRDGVVFGEGAAAVVLEGLAHASARGADIYGEYLGGGFTQDAWKVTVPSATRNFYRKAFELALKISGIRAGEIDLLNPHGAATSLGDKFEALTITELFGSYPRKPLITALKPFVGHNLGGSALMELVILLLAMKENVVPPTLNYTTPDPALKLRMVKEPTAARVQLAAKMSTGFGGYHAVAIFRNLAGGAGRRPRTQQPAVN